MELELVVAQRILQLGAVDLAVESRLVCLRLHAYSAAAWHHRCEPLDLSRFWDACNHPGAQANCNWFAKDKTKSEFSEQASDLAVPDKWPIRKFSHHDRQPCPYYRPKSMSSLVGILDFMIWTGTMR